MTANQNNPSYMDEINDNGTAPEFYVDDVAFVDNLGSNCRVAYFTYARNPLGVFERVVVVKIIRPKASLEHGKITRMMVNAESPVRTNATQSLQ